MNSKRKTNNDFIIDLVIKAKEKLPSLRFGQLLSNAAEIGGWKGQDIFYCPDEVIIDGLKKIIKR